MSQDAITETRSIENQSQHACNVSPVCTASTSISVSSCASFYKTFKLNV